MLRQQGDTTAAAVEAKLGVGWLPGHINIDSYIEDFEMLQGVANLDNHSLQPANGDNYQQGAASQAQNAGHIE